MRSIWAFHAALSLPLCLTAELGIDAPNMKSVTDSAHMSYAIYFSQVDRMHLAPMAINYTVHQPM